METNNTLLPYKERCRLIMKHESKLNALIYLRKHNALSLKEGKDIIEAWGENGEISGKEEISAFIDLTYDLKEALQGMCELWENLAKALPPVINERKYTWAKSLL